MRRDGKSIWPSAVSERIGCLLGALFALTACDQATAGSGGKTVINLSYDYAQVRLRPTYDPNIRGTLKTQLVLSGQNQISIRHSNMAGKHRASWSYESRAGSGWKFARPNELIRITDWPQSTSTSTVTTNGTNGCTYRVANKLKPGFSEFKTPMLSRHVFGYYKETAVSNLTCSIHNED